ncbi:MAG: hypothetical protein ACK55I_15935, partial [bacterium]
PSNTALDFFADKMDSISCLKGKFVRLLPRSRIDLFDLDETKIKPYHLIYHVLKNSEWWCERTPEEIAAGKNHKSSLKVHFENSMPNWKPTLIKGTKKN